jgi:hypothetical protein
LPGAANITTAAGDIALLYEYAAADWRVISYSKANGEPVAGGGATGNGGDKIFYENEQIVTTNYTVTNNFNAGSFGPITINSGISVTVGAGEVWSIV